ncbi:hypothetical protein KIPB_008610, partial [Kipferlia bialata]|eukprot:g8610.t1
MPSTLRRALVNALSLGGLALAGSLAYQYRSEILYRPNGSRDTSLPP